MFQGVDSQHDAVLLVGSTGKPYNHVGYSPLAMPRSGPATTPTAAGDFLDKALARLNKTRYISDGDPITVPESALEDLNPESLGDKELGPQSGSNRIERGTSHRVLFAPAGHRLLIIWPGGGLHAI